jgi:PAS domain-containing protein
VALGSLLIWMIAAWGTTARAGPFVRANMQESLLFAWSYIGTMSITALLLAAAIAERKRSETSLAASQARLQAIVENLPFDVWALDAEGRCVLQNSISVKIWGDFLGRRIEDMGLSGEVLASWQRNNQRIMTGEVLRGETDYLVDGQRRSFYYVTSPVREGDHIRGILGTNIDIT